MVSKSREVVILDDDELEDGEIEDDIEEFNEFESLFQSSDSTESRLNKSKTNTNKHNNKRERKSRSHSRTSHRREKSKSPSISRNYGVLSSRRRTSPNSSKRSHRKRTSSSADMKFAKGLRQKAESRLRRRRRGDSPPKPTMGYLLRQRNPTFTPHPKKKRRESDMEQYEHLLQKHRELQEAIEAEKSHLIRSSDPDVIEIEARPSRKTKSRSRSRSGSQKDALERVERKLSDEQTLVIQEDGDESDDEMDELQLRMIALQSATRAITAREEKENREIEQISQRIDKMKKENSAMSSTISPPAGSSQERARQEERKQKLAKWKKQHSLMVEINKATDEKSRYQLFMDHINRGGKSQDNQQNGQQQPSSKSDADFDSDVIEIPPPSSESINDVVTTQQDNYEPVEMEVDTEDSSLTPVLLPGVSYTNTAADASTSQPPPPGVSPIQSTPPTLPHTIPAEVDGDEAKDEDEDDEEEMIALRQLLLKSMQAKKAAKMQKEKEQQAETPVESPQPLLQADKLPSNKNQGSPMSSGTTSPIITNTIKRLRQTAVTKPAAKPKIPVHKPVIIRPGDDSDDSDDEYRTSKNSSSVIDMFLKEARKTASKTKLPATPSGASNAKHHKNKPPTPEAMSKLPDVHRAEYQRLKQEIVRREQKKQMPSTSTSSNGPVSALPDRLSKDKQTSIQSGSRSATASPDRSEHKSSKDASVSEPESFPSSAVDKEQAARKAQLQRMALLKKEAQRKEVKTCKEKMLKHRQAIEKGHRLLRNLDFQVDKKNKVVNLMQVRVKKLKQELLAAQKLVGVHNDQVNKFLEQKQQVKSRLEKHVAEEEQLRHKLAVALGKPVADAAQSNTLPSTICGANGIVSGPGAKRPLEPSTSSVNKKSKLKSATSSPSKSKSDDKLQELQKLERAYAHKIQQLKMDQARKAQDKMLHLSPAAARLMKARKLMPNVKPAKQVYSKDKIAFGAISSGNSSGEEGPSKSKRRKSWLDGQNSYLRPNLAQSSKNVLSQKLSLVSNLTKPLSPVKKHHKRTNTDSKSVSSPSKKSVSSPSKDAKKQDKNNKAPPEPIVEGLYMPNAAQLKLLQQIQAEKSQKGIDFVTLSHCFDTFQREASQDDGFDLVTGATIDGRVEEEEMVSLLQTYTSSLLPFKAYRVNPYFEDGTHITRHSLTVSHKINPTVPFCKYELNGKCNDEECHWQHERDYTVKELEFYEDLSSYMQLISSPESRSSNEEKIDKEFEKMMKLIEKEKDSGRIDVEKRKREMGKVCAERVRKHCQNKGISVLLKPRKQPKPYLKSSSRVDNPDTYPIPSATKQKSITKPESVCFEDTERYFFKTSEGLVDLEAAVLERPNDVDLWLKLAYKQFADDSTEKNLDKALHALSRGLESNKNNSVLWLHYLNLYEQRAKHPDLLQLCQQALDYAPDYEVWWKKSFSDSSLPLVLRAPEELFEALLEISNVKAWYLTLKPSFAEKEAECQKLLEFIQEQQKEKKTALGSHHLLEVLLYRVQLYIMTRRASQGLVIFQDALREYSITSLCRHLLPKDRCFAWMAYLHVMGFHCLPSCLFDPVTGALGRFVCKDPFMFPWHQVESSRLKIQESLIAGFQDALLSCSSSQLPIEDSIEICLPLYQNLFNMEAKLGRLNKAQSVCKHLLHDCPSSAKLWLCLVDIETKNESSLETITKVFKEALASCPTSAELYHHAAKFELEHDNKDEAIQYLRQCVMGYYDVGTNEINTQDVINLYRSLLHLHLPFNYKPPSLAESTNEETIEENLLHIWSCYCLYVMKTQSHEVITESFETGLCALKDAKDVQKLWIIYLEYQKSQLTSSEPDANQSWKVFSELINRCLVSMATVWPLPHSSTNTWLDFSFHNRVVEVYLGCVRNQHVGDAYELFLNRMPQNIPLAFRACQHAIEAGHDFHAQLIARSILTDYPTCISFWKIAVALCVRRGQTTEADQMYQRAVEACPLSASLWKDYLLFEVTRGKSRNELKKLIVRCRDEIGLNINDYLETIFKT